MKRHDMIESLNDLLENENNADAFAEISIVDIETGVKETVEGPTQLNLEKIKEFSSEHKDVRVGIVMPSLTLIGEKPLMIFENGEEKTDGYDGADSWVEKRALFELQLDLGSITEDDIVEVKAILDEASDSYVEDKIEKIDEIIKDVKEDLKGEPMYEVYQNIEDEDAKNDFLEFESELKEKLETLKDLEELRGEYELMGDELEKFDDPIENVEKEQDVVEDNEPFDSLEDELH
jgi:hypothetical protein